MPPGRSLGLFDGWTGAVCIAAATLLSVPGCTRRSPSPDAQLAAMFGPAVIRSASSAPTLAVERLLDTDPSRPWSQSAVPSATLTAGQDRRARVLLLSDSTFRWDGSRSKCIFHPDARFTFRSDDGRDLLVVTLCFTCREAQFSPGDLKSFLPGTPALRALVNEFFPDHPLPPA